MKAKRSGRRGRSKRDLRIGRRGIGSKKFSHELREALAAFLCFPQMTIKFLLAGIAYLVTNSAWHGRDGRDGTHLLSTDLLLLAVCTVVHFLPV